MIRALATEHWILRPPLQGIYATGFALASAFSHAVRAKTARPVTHASPLLDVHMHFHPG
jgi:hypothetical protein